jgi:hypothetical protein
MELAQRAQSSRLSALGRTIIVAPVPSRQRRSSVMKTKTKTARDVRPLVLAAFVAAGALLVATTHAETRGGDALSVSRFDRLGTAPVDALTVSTDHCVAQIAAGESTARGTCRNAVQHASTNLHAPVNFGTSESRRDLAVALGNLAVAEALEGDMESARSTTLRALTYAPQHPLLTANLRILESRRTNTRRTEMTAN